MLSKNTLKNLEILHTIGNYFGVIPIQLNVRELGFQGNSKIIFSGKLWTKNVLVQVFCRLIMSFILFVKIIFSVKVIPFEVAWGVLVLAFFLNSTVLIMFWLPYTETMVDFLNNFFHLNNVLCKSLY